MPKKETTVILMESRVESRVEHRLAKLGLNTVLEHRE